MKSMMRHRFDEGWWNDTETGLVSWYERKACHNKRKIAGELFANSYILHDTSLTIGMLILSSIDMINEFVHCQLLRSTRHLLVCLNVSRCSDAEPPAFPRCTTSLYSV